MRTRYFPPFRIWMHSPFLEDMQLQKIFPFFCQRISNAGELIRSDERSLLETPLLVLASPAAFVSLISFVSAHNSSGTWKYLCHVLAQCTATSCLLLLLSGAF